jgi:predicted NAD-dependent protein-ADP-ribosyltransferase YbiA (DUF1768 family)
MGDRSLHGCLTVICLKKCGSSQINRAFAEKVWEPKDFVVDPYTPKYFVAVRNPAHRLVSCWNHLVKFRYDARNIDPWTDHAFGPALCFSQWCDVIIHADHETINPHMRMQTYEIADHLLDEPDGTVFVAQLEQLTDLSCGHHMPPLSRWLNRRFCVKRARKASYGHWQDHYDRVQLQQVRWKFAADYHLWNHLLDTGHKIMGSHDLANFLNLTNGRDSCML